MLDGWLYGGCCRPLRVRTFVAMASEAIERSLNWKMWQRSLQTAVPLQSSPQVTFLGMVDLMFFPLLIAFFPPQKTNMEPENTLKGKGETSTQTTNFWVLILNITF